MTTPGRLVDHINDTPGFTLQHLQFLVVDEADRLLMQSYYDWLPRVLEALNETHEGQLLDMNGYHLLLPVIDLSSETVLDACTHRTKDNMLDPVQFPHVQMIVSYTHLPVTKALVFCYSYTQP